MRWVCGCVGRVCLCLCVGGSRPAAKLRGPGAEGSELPDFPGLGGRGAALRAHLLQQSALPCDGAAAAAPSRLPAHAVIQESGGRSVGGCDAAAPECLVKFK